MHTNNDYYNFLQGINGGEDLYERVINTEDLYRYGFYENVRNAARMVFECFINKICEIKKIDFIRKSDLYRSIDYTKTLKYIFNMSSIKDAAWYDNKDIEHYFEQVNIGSHNIGIEDEISNEIREDNEVLLYIIRDLCIWYYNRIGKIKKNLDGYELPTVIDREKVYKYISEFDIQKSENKYDIKEIKDSYEKIHNSLRDRNIDLNKQLIEANNKIEELINDCDLYQKKLKKFSEEKTIFEQKIDETNEIQKDYSTLIRNLKLEEKKKRRLEKEKAELVNQITIQETLIKNLENENQKLQKQNSILANKSLVKKLDVSQKNLTTQNERARAFYTNVKNAIKHMNNINCFATVVTLYKFFKGINSRQTYYYPKVKEHELWGKYVKEPRFEYRYLEQAINYLLRNDIIILNDDGVYEIVTDKDI